MPAPKAGPPAGAAPPDRGGAAARGRLKRPKSGLLSPEGDEEAADSVAEARARGASLAASLNPCQHIPVL